MVRQRTKNVFDELPNENDALAPANGFEQLLGGRAAQLRLQDGVKILFSKKIEAITADATEQGVKKARSKGAARGISEWPRQCHPRHARASRPAFRKALGVPSEKTYWAHRAEFQQRAFHSPIRNFTRVRGGRKALRIGAGACHGKRQTSDE